MDDGLPAINGPGGRIEITEADLAPPPSRAVRPPVPPSPEDATRRFASHADTGAGDWTEATRMMCTAAYLEPTFAQEVVNEIVHEEHRAVHMPTGVNIATVVKHCLAARRQKTARDLLLTADVVLSIVLAFAEKSVAWLALGFLLAWAIVLWDIWSATYLVVLRRLNPRSFPSYPAPMPSDPRLALRIEELARNQRGNLSVYSGFMPFSSAGVDTGDGWSFLIDLRKGNQDVFGGRSSAKEPTPAALYGAVEQALSALGMTNLEIRDRLFVSGSDVRDDRVLMPNPLGPPLAWVDAGVMQQFMVSPTHRIRHYRCIEIVNWRGELVVSLFLRFAVGNGRLFCELNKFVLPPLKEELHRLNHQAGVMRFSYLISMVVRAAATTPGLSLRAPSVIVRPLRQAMESSGSAKRVEKDPFFDFGAAATALDRVRSTKYRRYFQRLDKEKYDKVLERTVLDALVKVLDEHGVDTTELAEKRTMIVNNGIMMGNESKFNAHNLAVGSGSRSGTFHLPRRGGGADGGGAPPQS